MKCKLTIILIFVATLFSGAQNPINHYFEQYKDLDGVTTVSVSRPLIWLASLFVDRDVDPEAKEVLKQVSSVKVITINDAKLNSDINFLADLRKMKKQKSFKRRYSELMTVKESDQEVAIYCHEKRSGNISDLLIIVYDGQNTAIRIKGNIDPKRISSIGSSINFEGSHHLKKLNKSKQVVKNERTAI